MNLLNYFVEVIDCFQGELKDIIVKQKILKLLCLLKEKFLILLEKNKMNEFKERIRKSKIILCEEQKSKVKFLVIEIKWFIKKIVQKVKLLFNIIRCCSQVIQIIQFIEFFEWSRDFVLKQIRWRSLSVCRYGVGGSKIMFLGSMFWFRIMKSYQQWIVSFFQLFFFDCSIRWQLENYVFGVILQVFSMMLQFELEEFEGFLLSFLILLLFQLYFIFFLYLEF